MKFNIIVPLHVSGIWIPRYTDNPLETGSIGAGLNLSLKAIAEVERGSCEILVNNERRVFMDVAQKICSETGYDVSTKLWTPVELGSGFGLSAAILIAHALGSYFSAGQASIKALQRAHYYEVLNRTGLGDVIAIYTGGLAIRTKPGAPGIGYAYRIIPRTRVDLVAIDLGYREHTAQMLDRISSEIASIGSRLLERVIETEDLRVYFESSRLYTSLLFNYEKAREIARQVRGLIDYYLKKSALIMWIERDSIHDALSAIYKLNHKVFYTRISSTGVFVDYST